MTAQYQLLGMGAALVDTELKVTDAQLQQLSIDKGLMTLCDEKRQHEILTTLDIPEQQIKRASGGSAANSIIAASYLGCSTFFTCKVANDTNGDVFLNDMTTAGVVTNSNDQQLPGTTGQCLVMVTDDAERSMYTHLGISETLGPSNLHAEAIAAADRVYLESYLATSESASKAVNELCSVARDNGTQIALSLSDPGIAEFFRQQINDMVGGAVDLLFCNIEEACKWTGEEDIDKALQALANFAPQYAVTNGSDGAWVFDGQTKTKIAAEKVVAIDTNGAGDLFAGAFLAAINGGADFASAGKFACRCAAQVVTTFGPRLSAEQYRQLALELAAIY